MTHHVVLFQMNKDVAAEMRQKVMNEFKTNIEALKDSIDCIVSVTVGFNINEDENWDICLHGTFRSLEDVRNYSKHPDHVAAASRLKPFLSGRSCVDYETAE